MSLIFYYLSGSPFSWKVWLALEHKQIPYTQKILNAGGGDLSTREFLAISPWGKAPAIVHGEFRLYESSTIIEYLEDAFPQTKNSLRPKTIQDRATARRIAEEVSNYIYPPIRLMVEELMLRKTGKPDERVVVNASELVVKNLRVIAQNTTGDFFFGDEPCAADFALYPLVAMMDRINARRPDLELTANVPEEITKWRTKIEALDYFEKTLPPHWKT